jgi:hypothetical protein
MLYGIVCPRCRQNAPIVYRGIAAYCTACGAPRMPLTEKSVNLAGQPSQIGGTVARVFGWLVLGGGMFIALTLLAILQAIFPETFVGFAVGGGVGLATIASAWVLLRGGKNLKEGGKGQEKNARVQAIFAMAPMRGGVLRAAEVGAALQISPDAADAVLTDLAKTKSEYVSLEIDDQGGIYYRVDPSGCVRARIEAMPYAKVRVDEPGEVLEPEVEPPRARQAHR